MPASVLSCGSVCRSCVTVIARLASTHTALVSQSLIVVGLCFAFPSCINQSSQCYTPPSMEDGPTRTHTLHTIGSGADTRHTVTGRSIGSGPLDAQLTAHRTAHEVALCSTGAAGGGRKRQGGDADSGATQRQTDRHRGAQCRTAARRRDRQRGCPRIDAAR